jgi:hypothetical protein
LNNINEIHENAAGSNLDAETHPIDQGPQFDPQVFDSLEGIMASRRKPLSTIPARHIRHRQIILSTLLSPSPNPPANLRPIHPEHLPNREQTDPKDHPP